MTVPRAEIQTLTPGSRVVLYELDATGIGGELTRWAPELNELGQPIVFQGQTYNAFPLEAEGFERTTDGPVPSPKLRASNLDGQVGAMCREFGDLVGATVTRRTTLVKFLDAVNFASGVNPNAGAYEFPPETWVIEQKTAETREVIEWELTSVSDASGRTLPGRKMHVDTCAWTTTAQCPHVGTCGKTLAACQANYPSADLPFGGFPGMPQVAS